MKGIHKRTPEGNPEIPWKILGGFSGRLSGGIPEGITEKGPGTENTISLLFSK